MRCWHLLLLWLLIAALGGCSPKDDNAEFERQKFYFLESMQQVDSGGMQLQAAGLDHLAVQQALDRLDQGLKLAFQVDRDFLDRLDLRLGKNFQRYFIAGVENYRLGIEAGDQQQQLEGLKLLRQWADFWKSEAATIEAALHPQ